MEKRPVLEVCVDSVEAAMAAQGGGADRVALCADLMAGGTTPSAGAIQLARQHITIGLNVIIRPRGGDFCYSDIESEVMKRDIEIAREAGADGVVVGMLRMDGSVDTQRTGMLMEIARPLGVTFHRAFDMCRDPCKAMGALMDLGVDRVLTSGQEASALEGLDLIADLVERAGGRMIVVPCGAITERNVGKIVRESGAKEVHIAAPVTLESCMDYRNSRCFMGGELRPPEFAINMTDRNRVTELVRAIGAN